MLLAVRGSVLGERGRRGLILHILLLSHRLMRMDRKEIQKHRRCKVKKNGKERVSGAGKGRWKGKQKQEEQEKEGEVCGRQPREVSER